MMLENIISSDGFTRMIHVCSIWILLTIVVLLFSCFSGVLTHPLMRAKKKLLLIKSLCLQLESQIKSFSSASDKLELIKALRKIIKRKKSISTSLNVYIYDDISKKTNVGSFFQYLDEIEAKCKNALLSVFQNDWTDVAEEIHMASDDASALSQKLDDVIKKDAGDKLLKL